MGVTDYLFGAIALRPAAPQTECVPTGQSILTVGAKAK
jgi:hypothetical protein